MLRAHRARYPAASNTTNRCLKPGERNNLLPFAFRPFQFYCIFSSIDLICTTCWRHEFHNSRSVFSLSLFFFFNLLSNRHIHCSLCLFTMYKTSGQLLSHFSMSFMILQPSSITALFLKVTALLILDWFKVEHFRNVQALLLLITRGWKLQAYCTFWGNNFNFYSFYKSFKS